MCILAAKKQFVDLFNMYDCSEYNDLRKSVTETFKLAGVTIYDVIVLITMTFTLDSQKSSVISAKLVIKAVDKTLRNLIIELCYRRQ